MQAKGYAPTRLRSERILFDNTSLLPHQYTFLLIVPLIYQVSSRVSNRNTHKYQATSLLRIERYRANGLCQSPAHSLAPPYPDLGAQYDLQYRTSALLRG